MLRVALPRKYAHYLAVRNYEITVDIDAPPARVWDVMMDVERWNEWTPTVTSVEPLTPGEMRVGSRYRIKQPKLSPAVMTVTHVEPDRGFTWNTSMPGITVRANHAIAPRGNGSRVVLSLEFGGLMGGIVGRVYRNLNQRYIAEEAAGLKKRSENPPATARLR